ncbi:hypothetical protein LEP1GSC127_1307 [Leptospira kirschneri str. 200801925]|uniref:Uncharacterized protein n=1 Tax=Leptospira kirschneri str. 200802841 TaxID=1193047 RepID=A0A828Y952_9LEPT|nr:hypothetical protein LEP1GSC131_1391 [Leptospira kirschneri str. 200802841]EMO75392.1 hypothetical protein LEP1GSC127_1307 [Leptospira kirschneri str. 200801925]
MTQKISHHNKEVSIHFLLKQRKKLSHHVKNGRDKMFQSTSFLNKGRNIRF